MKNVRKIILTMIMNIRIGAGIPIATVVVFTTMAITVIRPGIFHLVIPMAGVYLTDIPIIGTRITAIPTTDITILTTMDGMIPIPTMVTITMGTGMDIIADIMPHAIITETYTMDAGITVRRTAITRIGTDRYILPLAEQGMRFTPTGHLRVPGVL